MLQDQYLKLFVSSQILTGVTRRPLNLCFHLSDLVCAHKRRRSIVCSFPIHECLYAINKCESVAVKSEVMTRDSNQFMIYISNVLVFFLSPITEILEIVYQLQIVLLYGILNLTENALKSMILNENLIKVHFNTSPSDILSDIMWSGDLEVWLLCQPVACFWKYFDKTAEAMYKYRKKYRRYVLYRTQKHYASPAMTLTEHADKLWLEVSRLLLMGHSSFQGFFCLKVH